MLLKSRGIVLNALKYNDETLIAQVLTEEVGYRTFSVRISRGRKTRSAHIFFFPLSLVELTWDEKPNARLVSPKTVSTSSPLISLLLEPPKVTIAMFLGEFLTVLCVANPRRQTFSPICTTLYCGWMHRTKGVPTSTSYSYCAWPSSWAFFPNARCISQADILICKPLRTHSSAHRTMIIWNPVKHNWYRHYSEWGTKICTSSISLAPSAIISCPLSTTFIVYIFPIFLNWNLSQYSGIFTMEWRIFNAALFVNPLQIPNFGETKCKYYDETLFSPRPMPMQPFVYFCTKDDQEVEWFLQTYGVFWRTW